MKLVGSTLAVAVLCSCGSATDATEPNMSSNVVSQPGMAVSSALTNSAVTIATTPALVAESPTTLAAVGEVIVETTAAFPHAGTTTEQHRKFDTATVPQLRESADVVSLDLASERSILTARFGPSSAGGVVVEVYADGQQIAGMGAPQPDILEGTSTTTFLPSGAVVDHPRRSVGSAQDGVEVVADGSRVSSLVTGVWSHRRIG